MLHIAIINLYLLACCIIQLFIISSTGTRVVNVIYVLHDITLLQFAWVPFPNVNFTTICRRIFYQSHMYLVYKMLITWGSAVPKIKKKFEWQKLCSQDIMSAFDLSNKQFNLVQNCYNNIYQHRYERIHVKLHVYYIVLYK